MKGFQHGLAVIAVAAIAFASSGCNTQQELALPPSGVNADARSEGTSQAEIQAELAKLSDADREQASAQRLCPVSGEPLGSMGAPIKVIVGDNHLFICCAGCEAKARKHFDEYLAKLETNPRS